MKKFLVLIVLSLASLMVGCASHSEYTPHNGSNAITGTSNTCIKSVSRPYSRNYLTRAEIEGRTPISRSYTPYACSYGNPARLSKAEVERQRRERIAAYSLGGAVVGAVAHKSNRVNGALYGGALGGVVAIVTD